MDELFSCRNCVQNCAQTLTIGPGQGFCLQHNSVIQDPERTTCKYLHRKDLPRFLVDDSIREHAAEFALFPALVDLYEHKPVRKFMYSERYSWEHGEFDPSLHVVAQYHKVKPTWVFIQAFSGDSDGRRALAHASFVRRYLDNCGSWVSSYRLVLGVVQELDVEPHFDTRALVGEVANLDEARVDALWEVVFVRLAAIQEYGWHTGEEHFMWITDRLNGGLTTLDWPTLQGELSQLRDKLTAEIIGHAKAEGIFFKAREEELLDE